MAIDRAGERGDPDALRGTNLQREALAKRVQQQVLKRTRGNPIAAQSLGSRGAILLAGSLEQGIKFSKSNAPEHLTAGGF